MPSRPITAKQQRFVDEYLIDYNATKAAGRAGYSDPNFGRQLLTNPNVSQAIEAGKERQRKQSEMTADEVVREITLIAKHRANQMYRPDGSLKAPSEWDDSTAASISGVEVDEAYQGEGQERRVVGMTKKVKTRDKLKALEMLGKRFNLWKDQIEVNVTGPPFKVYMGFDPKEAICPPSQPPTK